MPRYEIESPDGRKMIVEGSSPPTQEQAAELFSQIKIQPERSTGEVIGGAFDAAANIITSGIAKPVSGLVGLTNLARTQDPESARLTQQNVERSLTYQPSDVGEEYLQAIGQAPILKQIGEVSQGAADYAGRKTLDITGSPALASIAQGIPEAAGFALGAKVPAGIAAMQASKAQAQMLARARSDAGLATLDDVEGMRESEAGKALRSGNIKKIAKAIDPNPKFYKALENLGVTAEPLASYGSRNPRIKAIDGAFSAIPGSDSNLAAKVFATDVSNVAHALMEKAGASLDAPAKSMDWRAASMKTIDQLGLAAEEAYGALNKVIDKKAPMQSSATLDFINEAVKDLPAGIDDPSVPKVLKRVYRALQPRKIATESGEQAIPANYASIDLERKNIGAAAFKKEGDFKDADSSLLKKIYGKLSDDTNAIAESQGLADQVGAAKALVSQRKGLEENIQSLLGKNLTDDVIPVVQRGLDGLSKGGAQRYIELMESIPSKSDRRELVTTAIANMFNKTTEGEARFNTTAYLKWYNDTMGKGSVRRIVGRDLDKETVKVLDDLSVIAKGIATTNASKIPTGVVKAVLDDDLGFVRKLVGQAGRSVSSAPLMNVMGDALVSLAERASKRTETAAKMLASPELSNIIRRGVAMGISDGKKASESIKLAEKRLMQSANYQEWQNSLTPREIDKVKAKGLAVFLLAPEQQGEEND